jgi:hypothetical protein
VVVFPAAEVVACAAERQRCLATVHAHVGAAGLAGKPDPATSHG